MGGYTREQQREKRLLVQYGLTQAQYDTMFVAQEGCCAICRKVPKPETILHVDHCHITDKVRGLLCSQCNTGLGCFRDSVHSLLRATAYIEKTDTQKVLSRRLLNRIFGKLRKG